MAQLVREVAAVMQEYTREPVELLRSAKKNVPAAANFS